MDGAAARGRLDILQSLLATRTEGCSTKAFVGAAANGHLVVLHWLVQHYPEHYNLEECLTVAAAYGQVDVVKSICQHRWDTYHLYNSLIQVVEAAAANGYVEVLAALELLPFNLTGAFTTAASHGHLHVLKWFWTNHSSRIFGVDLALSEAAEHDNCAVAEFLIHKCGEYGIDQALIAAARVGGINVVRLILTTCEVNELTIAQAIKDGVDNSRYDTVELLLERSGWPESSTALVLSCSERYWTPCCYLNNAFRSALMRGDLRMVSILAKCCPPDEILCGLIRIAGTSRSCDMVKLLLDTYAARHLIEASLQCAIAWATQSAISGRNIAAARLLIDECDEYGANEALLIAVRMNHTELVKLCAAKASRFYKIMALVQAAEGKQIDILDSLITYVGQISLSRALKKLPPDTDIAVAKMLLYRCEPKSYPGIFRSAAARGLLSLVDYLQHDMDTYSVRRALMDAVMNGHSNVVNTLLRSVNSDVVFLGRALEVAMTKGNVDIVDQLRGHCDQESIASALAFAKANDQTEIVHLLGNKKSRLV